jgi:DNA-binding beta-propeller fold protein YncE
MKPFYRFVLTLALALALSASVPANLAAQDFVPPHPDRFTLFESGPVRPLALSEDGKYLFAANTPDGRLEIFRLHQAPDQPLTPISAVQVGLEPVAVAVRGDQVWVVNHLSDSVSVVDVHHPHAPAVVRTLLVGDEPRDIVFAGTGPHGSRRRAFITTAHRGQNHPQDPQLSTPGIGRADVWIFDADHPGDALGGTPLTIVNLFADTPRALAVSPDGATVYAAAFHSGNRTTSLHDLLITNGGEAAEDGMGLPGPNTNFQGIPQPETGLLVRFNGAHWVDEEDRVWDAQVRLNLPDQDVFQIDAMADPPREIDGAHFTSVGTVLFNLAVNPATGVVYASNTEARNAVRFEGSGEFGTTVRGNVHQVQITVLKEGGTSPQTLPRHLNKHVDFAQCCEPIPNPVGERSLAGPLEMAVTADGATLYLAAFGSSKVGIFSTAELEADTFTPDADDHIAVTGGGPAGLVLDEARGRLYVLTRFDNGISVIDTTQRSEMHHRTLPNPEPLSVVEGRPFLYDARLSSSNGTTACGSCHIFGDLDSLAWDLGDPGGEPLANPGPFIAPPFDPDPKFEPFQPMKGPMTTQSLRGMANHGPMHWRGDRTGANDVAESAQPNTGLFDEDAAFKKFNPAFVGLNGRPQPLTAVEMQRFADFALQLTYPPNPIRNLDGTLTPAQQRGRDHYFAPATEAGVGTPPNSCNDCHVLNPQGNAEFGVERPGFFGGDGRLVVEGDDFLTPENGSDLQPIKVPHFRNAYQKVGMFGTRDLPNSLPFDDSHQGDQIRGFGYLHDGSTDTPFRFLQVVGFSQIVAPNGFPVGPEGQQLARDVEAFLFAFDTNLAPIVGQQITLDGANGAVAGTRIELLVAQAAAGHCELVVTTRQRGFERGYLYLADEARFQESDSSAPRLIAARLRALAAQAPLTYTCLPVGSGYRVALDADLDGCFNVDEVKAGTDPRDGGSVPPDC